jgi:hypothetical protein
LRERVTTARSACRLAAAQHTLPSLDIRPALRQRFIHSRFVAAHGIQLPPASALVERHTSVRQQSRAEALLLLLKILYKNKAIGSDCRAMHTTQQINQQRSSLKP